MQTTQAKRFREYFDNFAEEWAHQVDLGLAATDADYLEFQRTVNANIKAGPRIRNEILLRKLFQFDPNFVSNLNSVLLAEAGVSDAIDEIAEEIQEIIADINDVYSSKHGKDLFKATNKTMKAMKALAKPVSDVGGYETLIENLYFLLWEGPGTKLATKPQSFVDVNILRTDLQHDVDHGKEKDVAKKKKGAGDTFAKYAGASSPKSASGEALQVAQLKLLSEIKADLEVIEEAVS